MAMFIAVANAAAIVMLWLGPETRGRRFDATDDAHKELAEAVA